MNYLKFHPPCEGGQGDVESARLHLLRFFSKPTKNIPYPLPRGIYCCINLSKSDLRGLLFPSDIAKLGTKKTDEEYSSIGVKFLKVLRKVLAFHGSYLKVFGLFHESFGSFLKVFSIISIPQAICPTSKGSVINVLNFNNDIAPEAQGKRVFTLIYIIKLYNKGKPSRQIKKQMNTAVTSN